MQLALLILQVLAQLLPELIGLAKSLKDSPQEIRLKRLAEVRAAMKSAGSKLGHTSPIEDIING